MAKPIPYDDNDDERGEHDERDQRWVILYDDEVLKLMQGWTGGIDDPLYAISSTGGANYAWVFEDAIANLDSDIRRVKKIGRNKYQLGKGEFTKQEIDELHQIRDALAWALESWEPSGDMDERPRRRGPDRRGRRGRRHVAFNGLDNDGDDEFAAIASWNRGDAYRDGSLRLLIDKGLVEHTRRGWVPTKEGARRGLRMTHLETRARAIRYPEPPHGPKHIVDPRSRARGNAMVRRRSR